MKYVNVMRLLDSNMDLNSAAMNLTFVSVEVGKELDVIRVGDKERHREGERERERGGGRGREETECTYSRESGEMKRL